MKKYLLNTNSKRIHLANSLDGRCKIKGMRSEYLHFFDTLEEAESYPRENAPLAKKCAFCFKNSNCEVLKS